MIRFVHLFNYATGVSVSDGEAWYLGKHVPHVKKLSGVQRYLSWRAIEPPPIPYPSSGAPTPFDQFVRRSELWFEDFEAWQQAYRTNPTLWTPSEEGVPGFREFECMFLKEEPQYDLLRDVPPQQYKYITLPLMWPKGPPHIDENEEIFIDSYCLSYGSVGLTYGEDWYLGHHTREGKQLPGIKHYKTWKTIQVPKDPNSFLQPNKWDRLTELGMGPQAFKANMVNDETRIRFTPSPMGNLIGEVYGGWLNIAINLEDVQDLLK